MDIMFDCISDTIVQCIILVLRQLCVGPAPGGWVLIKLHCAVAIISYIHYT